MFERIVVEEMPLVRYEVRCEHSLADPELYRKAFVEGGDDSSRALLDGVAMAGLVGIIRQLGDLAEYVFVFFSSSSFSFSLQHCFVAFFFFVFTEKKKQQLSFCFFVFGWVSFLVLTLNFTFQFYLLLLFFSEFLSACSVEAGRMKKKKKKLRRSWY